MIELQNIITLAQAFLGLTYSKSSRAVTSVQSGSGEAALMSLPITAQEALRLNHSHDDRSALVAIHTFSSSCSSSSPVFPFSALYYLKVLW